MAFWPPRCAPLESEPQGERGVRESPCGSRWACACCAPQHADRKYRPCVHVQTLVPYHDTTSPFLERLLTECEHHLEDEEARVRYGALRLRSEVSLLTTKALVASNASIDDILSVGSNGYASNGYASNVEASHMTTTTMTSLDVNVQLSDPPPARQSQRWCLLAADHVLFTRRRLAVAELLRQLATSCGASVYLRLQR